ncbi:hypothetical protein AB9P05_18745 [Roseivirga sp. BDSF3-8]|uniref:hypothetical protein n=1 Tax=Roseivirga sp. BDSF3-8 TaxID=3241598 RepID=UPI003531F7A3
MKYYRSQTALPDISNLPSALSGDQPIEINGAKVEFDHKVALMPVELEEIPADYRRNRQRYE